MYLLHYANNLIDFFLPRFCLHCNIRLNSTERVVCPECYAGIQLMPNERLEYEYSNKFADEKIINGVFSPFVFQPGGSLQTLLHELKYKSRFRIGNFLGKILAEFGEHRIKKWNIDIIIPMPLHKIKKAERGYNQSDHIAKSVGRILTIPVQSNLVKRIRFTQSQTKLSIAERKLNMSGAFKVKRPRAIAGKNILIIDDVITTGASVIELGRELKREEAMNIYAASIAFTD